MKFIADLAAPDIPYEILKAQTDGNLVLFCGAGISCNAGLPTFKGLVDAVYKSLSSNQDDCPLESKAFKNMRYDEVFNFLERRFGKKEVRTQIKKILSLKKNEGKNKEQPDLSTHQAILKIASNKTGTRLVTTNFDDGFILSQEKTITKHTAPALPIPKREQWSSIVYLHGIIDEKNDPEYANLVLTSSDLGKAYLTNGWATKFLIDLFQNFTVLFIGYSLNDPVVSYLTDAIAAEREENPNRFKQPYILASYNDKKKEYTKKLWESKGIIPILYRNIDKKHQYLHKTLKELDKYIMGGQNSRAKIISEYAKQKPTNLDNKIPNLLDILKGNLPNDWKTFSEIPASIEWIFALSKDDDINDSILAKFYTDHPKLFWDWIANYLENEYFIEWCIDNGAPFLTFIKEQIKKHITKKSLSEPYLTFWKILVSSIQTAFHSARKNDYDIYDKKDFNDASSLWDILKNLEPVIVFKKGYDAPYNVDIDIGLSYPTYKHIKKSKNYPEFLCNSVLSIIHNLQKTLELFVLIKPPYADNADDPSFIWLRSISPHTQNNEYHSWTILIEILRDVWECINTNRPHFAQTIIDIWKESNHPTFKRLVLHAYMKSDPFKGLDYLLEEDGKLLWDRIVKREKYRLLNSIVSENLCPEHINRLIAQILKRPIFPEELKENRDRDIYIMLIRLQQFGMKLPQNAQDCITEIKNENPNLPTEDKIDEQFEFRSWSSSNNYDGFPTDIDETSMFSLTPDGIIEKLREKASNFWEGRLYTFKMGCTKADNYEKCLDIIKRLNPTDIAIWKNALTGISRSPKFKWENIEVTLNSLNDNMFLDLGDSIKECLYKLRNAPDNTSFQISIELFEKLISQWGKDIQGDGNIWDQAINRPFGELTEVVLRLFDKTKDTDPSTSKKYLDLLTLITKSSNITGKVILAFHLSYLLQEAPSWTRENFIKYFQTPSDIWQGFLNNPRQSLDALDVLKEPLKNILIKRWTLLEEKSTVELISSLASDLCINFPRFYGVRDKQNIFRKQGINGLKFCAEFIWRSIENIELTDHKDYYWKNKIEPFLKEIWPKDQEFQNATISYYLTQACLQTTKEFSNAVTLISKFLIPINENDFHYLLAEKMNTDDFVSLRRANEIIDLLDKIIPQSYSGATKLPKLEELIRKIKQKEPVITLPNRIESLMT